MAVEKNSSHSIEKASQSSVQFSKDRNTHGATGVTDTLNSDAQSCLDKNGESSIINPPTDGFADIHVGLCWNNTILEKSKGLMSLIKKATKQGVDLDLGCFFELKDGTRGILQPFGELFGKFDTAPYIELSGDNRTGDSEGDDEYFTINGQKWSEIKRILIYAYIYEGGTDWSQIAPQVNINIHNGDPTLHLTPTLKTSNMTVCALATMKNIKNGIQIVQHGEYFTSQAEMDRAFGFGLKWEDGVKI
jgi:tellurite resistance protein TerA